jgi:hypothetical protein
VSTKEAWEVAWERQCRKAAKMAADGNPAANDMRACYQFGYLAAVAEMEATVRAAKREAIAEIESLSHELYAHPHMSDVNLRREVAKRLLAKYTDPTGGSDV